ncbi:hypothetical protein MHYP_G00050730 [Metynnis hypsauchen]
MCLASFCETHLQTHYEVPSWKKHKLVKASTRLREKICSQHDKLIEIYCRTDQTCICYLCMLDQHKGHDSVSAAAERTEKQNQLKEMQMKSQQRIQENQKRLQELKQAVNTIKSSAQTAVEDSERIFTELICSIEKKRCESQLKEIREKSQQRLQEKEKKLQELKQAVNTIKSSAQTAVEDNERIFTELICSIEKKRSEVTELIRAQEKAELSGAEELIEQLEQGIADLKRRDTELEQLSHTEDHIHFLQSLQSLCVSSGSEDSPNLFIRQHLSFDKVSKSLSDLKKQLEEFCEETLNRISPHAAAVQILLSEPQTREDFLQYFCYLTLDPNTARHDSVSAAAERTEKQSQLKEMQSESQKRVQEKEKKLQELKQAVNTIKSSAQTAVEDSERIFTELICSIEKKRSEVTELIRAQEKAELSGAEELIEQLEKEIADLKRRDTELEQLSHTEDHIHFLQSLQSLCVSSGSEDSPNLFIRHHLSFDEVSKSLSDLKKQLEEFCEETLNRISPQATAVQILLSEPKTREDFLQYYCQLTLDPNTARQNLILSEKNRVVTYSHDTVAAVAERTERQSQLKEMQSESQKRIQEKEKKLQELKQAVNTIKSSAQTAVEDSERIFTELICSIEKKQSEVTELIRAQEKAELSGAEELIEQLEQEIVDLKRRDTELEQLSHTEDHIHFLQSFQSLCVSSGSEDSPKITVSQHLSFDKVSKSLSDLKKQLEEFCEETLNRISPHAAAVQILLSEPQTREDFLQCM